MRLILILVVAFIFRLLISTSIYSGDVNNHAAWGDSILKFGFSGAYDREYVGVMQPTYPPLALYGFTTSTGLYNLSYGSAHYFNDLVPVFPSTVIWSLENQNVLPAFNKIFSILTDIGIGLLIFRFTKKLWVATIYLFNPAVWYLSALWGQLESFPLFFLLLAIYLLIRKKTNLAHLSFVASLLAKQSTIIFFPLFVLLSIRKSSLSKTLVGLSIQLGTFYLAYLPFMGKFDLLWPFKVYINRLQTGSGSVWISDHAFNLWAVLTKLQKIPDSTAIIFGLSAATIGFIIFGVLSGSVIIKMLKATSIRMYFLAFTLLPMLSFLTLTKMHERYFAPALPFLALSASIDPFIWPIYITVSFAHLANIWHDWYFPRIAPLDTWITTWTAISLMISLFTICTIITFIRFHTKRI